MAIEDNIPTSISIPGSLIGRHEESFTSPMSFSSFSTNMKSDISPMGFAAFTTRMKSDISPMGFAAFTTRMKSDVAPMSTLSFSTNMKSDVAPMSTLSFSTNMKSDVAPMSVSQFNANLKSDISPVASTLGANNQASSTAPLTSTLGINNQTSNTAPVNSTLGANNESSNTSPVNSTLGANNESSNTSPVNSILGANNESSNTSPVNSILDGRHESSGVDDGSTTVGGRHESSGVDDGATTLGGRHEVSSINDGATTLGGRHESSGVDDGATTLSGRHESSGVDDGATTLSGRHESSGIDDGLTIPDGRFTDSSINDTWNQDITLPIQQADLSAYAQPGTANWLVDTHALGFILNKEPLQTDYTPAGLEYSSYPGSPAPSSLDGRHQSSIVDHLTGVNFLDIPNAAATGFTIQAPKYNTQFIGAVDNIYTYPDPYGIGAGLVDTQIANGVNFLDIDNLDATGFTPSQPYMHSQFIGISGQGPKPTYDYPDTHGLGFGILSNALFSAENTPYTSVLKPDGFSKDRGDELEVSLFSKNSFAGGGILGASTEFTHATFGGVQGQVPVMGNNPTGLGKFLEGGKTSGDIGIVDAFDDEKSGAKGFTPNMFDLGLPKTQFNGVAGTPGSLEYTYPTEVGPDGEGRLMYNMPFADAGNPYGGAYVSHLAAQIPVNPKITINKGARTDTAEYSLYKSEPSGLTGIVDTDPARPFFSEGNKYDDIIGNFTTDIMINNSHPNSFLGDFASREGSPTPLDAMEVLIPANTGPTGEADITAKYTHVSGHPNYNTHNLSYGAAEVANQRQGFERNELLSRHGDYDYNKSALYGHDITFGGQGDDPNGLKMYKEPHILRDMDTNWGAFGGFDEGAFRGGFLTLGNRALKDVVRNVKHIIEDPIKGLLWGLKQIGLQASNPKVETEMFFLGRRTRVFNLGIGLIANMLTGPFGIKLYRHGLLNGIGEGDATYEKAVKAHGGINPYDPDKGQGIGKDTVGKGGGNRLAQLQRELLYFGGEDLAKTTAVTAGLPYSYKGEPIKLLSGIAGPKSLYGIGQTRIRRWEKTDSHMTGNDIAQQIPDTVGGGRSSLLAKYATLSHIGLEIAAEQMIGNESSHMDFRKAIGKGSGEDAKRLYLGDHESFGYDKFNRDAKFGYSKYKNDRDRTKIPKTFSQDDKPEHWVNDGAADYDDFDQGYTDDVDEIEGVGRDMIKFIIHDIPRDRYVRMRSYVTDIVDTITPDWQTANYIGRPDGVHSYKSTSRSISMTLKFAAMSQTGMLPMYKKVNYLMGLAYPHLAKGLPNEAISETMVAPLVKLTMGDWLYKCPGYFNSMAYTIDNDYPWEINLQNDPMMGQLPMMLSVGLEFVVIGDGPHISAVETNLEDKLAGTHIGGGVSLKSSLGKFYEDLAIPGPTE